MISSDVRVEGGFVGSGSEVVLGTGIGGGGGGDDGRAEVTAGGKTTIVVSMAGGEDMEGRVIVSRVVEGASVTVFVPGVSLGGAMIIEVTVSVGIRVIVTSEGWPLLT